MIYLVLARSVYESDCVLRAYAEKSDADAFAERCQNHQNKKPILTTGKAADKVWLENLSKWAKDHPAGDTSRRYTSFLVYPIPLIAWVAKLYKLATLDASPKL